MLAAVDGSRMLPAPKRPEKSISVKLKDLSFLVKLFKIVATDGDIDEMITNDPATDLTTPIVRGRNDVQWDSEPAYQLLEASAYQSIV
jgi:hypothetical protein